MSIKNRIISVTPMICLIAYLAIGFIWNIWHPTWAIFFLIIIVPIVLNSSFSRIFYPILCIAAFVILGAVWGYWHPAWLIFLTIPVYYTLFEPCFQKKKKRIEVIEKD